MNGFVISEIGPMCWQLCEVAPSGQWAFINRFHSEAAAHAAMADLISASKWIASSPKYYSPSGAPI